MIDPVEIYAAASPSSLMRCARVSRPGLFRLARRDCELYSVQIVGSGTFTRVKMMTGARRMLWEQISTFTGSFWLSAFSEEGLLCEIHALNQASSPNLTVNWRERDRSLA